MPAIMEGSEAYPLKSICLFCSSATGLKPSYTDAGSGTPGTDGVLMAACSLVHEELTRALSDRSRLLGTPMTFVYGGGDWGLMGMTARMALAADLRVIGVVPEFMRTTAGETHGHTEWVQTMAERKNRMAQLVRGGLLCPSAPHP